MKIDPTFDIDGITNPVIPQICVIERRNQTHKGKDHKPEEMKKVGGEEYILRKGKQKLTFKDRRYYSPAERFFRAEDRRWFLRLRDLETSIFGKALIAAEEKLDRILSTLTELTYFNTQTSRQVRKWHDSEGRPHIEKRIQKWNWIRTLKTEITCTEYTMINVKTGEALTLETGEKVTAIKGPITMGDKEYQKVLLDNEKWALLDSETGKELKNSGGIIRFSSEPTINSLKLYFITDEEIDPELC